MASFNSQYDPEARHQADIPMAPAGQVSAQKFLSEDEEEGINLRDYIVKCLGAWRWFAASVIFFVGIGALYILSTPKLYTRMAEVMIKDEDSGQQNISAALSDLGIGQVQANVANELIAFQSPELIGKVVERLGLRTSYTVCPLLRDKTLYGDSLVVAASFPGMTRQKGMSMSVKLLGKGRAKVSDIVSGKDSYDGTLEVTLGDTVSTPLGSFVLTPGPSYETDYPYTIDISHSPLPEAIISYQKKYSADIPDEDATVIRFSMTDTDIPLVTDFLETLISIYNEEWKQDKEQMAVATSNFINERLSVIEKELGNVDSDIAEYKGKNLLPDIEEATKLFMQDASENTKRQVEVGTQVAITQYLIDYLRAPENANKLLPANTGVESQGIQKQIDEYNTQVLKRNRIANASGDSSPMVLELDEALASIKSAMVASLGNLKSALSTELRSLVRSDEENNRKIASSPTKAKYLLSVERQQKVKEALYLFLLQQREENELSLAFTPSNLRLITPPWGQDKPTSPVSRNVLMICLAAGLLIPAAFIFVSESLDNYVRSRADLEVLHAPFLGEVPEANTGGAGLKRFKRRWRNIMGKASAIEAAPELFVHAHGRSIINESFRMLRSNVEFVSRAGSSAKVFMVTSFNPGSGKSFISLNLAAAFAVKKKDQRVLIIDLDLRRASVSRVVGNSQRGISDYLSEAADDVAPMIRPTKCDGLYILPVGTIPPNPAELLYSPRLQALLDKLRAEYDYIFLDCPPVEIVADTAIVNPLADATVFVMRAGLMDRRLLPELNLFYDTRRYKNLMTVLNGTTAGVAPYRKYAYSNYYVSSKEA